VTVELTPESFTARTVADLQSAFSAQAARVHFAQDALHVLELLAEGPKGFNIIVHWAGDESFGDQETQPMAEQILEVTVSQNPGLSAQPNEKIYTSTESEDSLLKRVRDVRGHLLSRQWEEESTGQFPSYRGTQPVVLPDGTRLRAYSIRIALAAAIYFDEYEPMGDLS